MAGWFEDYSNINMTTYDYCQLLGETSTHGKSSYPIPVAASQALKVNYSATMIMHAVTIPAHTPNGDDLEKPKILFSSVPMSATLFTISELIQNMRTNPAIQQLEQKLKQDGWERTDDKTFASIWVYRKKKGWW
jgi:hypothetical protein